MQSTLGRIYLDLRPTERTALMEHQRRIADGDRDRRWRAIKEYRKYLAYLERIGRIDAGQREWLEAYRVEKRHTETAGTAEKETQEQMTL